MPQYASLLSRLMSNTRQENTCCIWTGYCQNQHVKKPETPGAYGRINIQKDGRSLKFPVHRVSKVLEEIMTLRSDFDFYNPLDKQSFFELYQAYSICGMSIDHLCKKSLCINPFHLEWVHLTKNQQRKKWSQKRRFQRIQKQDEKKTRHYKSLVVSSDLREWIKKIKSRKSTTK